MSVYLNPIASGIMVSLLIIYLAFIPMLVHQYRKYGTLRMRGNIVIASFILYMITAWFMTILPLPSFEAVSNMGSIQPNFRPFLFVDTFLNESGYVLTKPRTWLTAMCSSSFFTVAFNVILMIPFGVYLRKYFKLCVLWAVVLGFLLSLFYEVTQYTGLYGIYPHAYRLADVDDLIVNTLGAVSGYFFAGYIDQLLPNPAKDCVMITDEVSFLRRLLSLLVDSITISVLFHLSRIMIYWNAAHREWDLVLFLVSEGTVFLLLPLLTRNKQTVGMLALNIYFHDKKGECAKTSRVIFHNFFVGIGLNIVYGMQEMMPSYVLEIILFQMLFILLQILLIIWLCVMIFKSLAQKKVCYYWEPWFDIYLKASLPNHKARKSVKERDKYEKCT